MSESTRKSKQATWIASIAGAVALYLLTYPLILGLAVRYSPQDVNSAGRLNHPNWVIIYGSPYIWLGQQVPFLGEALMKYRQWWYDRIAPQTPR